MDLMILAKILTAHNIVYFILSTLIAMAIVNKTKFTNKHLVWIIPVVWIGLLILFAILGGLFKLAVGLLVVVGIVIAVVMYLKKQAA